MPFIVSGYRSQSHAIVRLWYCITVPVSNISPVFFLFREQLLSFCREHVSCQTSLEMWKPQMLRCSDNTSFAFNTVSRVQELVNSFISSWFCFHFFSVPPRLALGTSNIQNQCLPEDGGTNSILSYKQPSWRPWSFPAWALDLKPASLYDQCV